jgi:Flp pilus assembly pilin Flp
VEQNGAKTFSEVRELPTGPVRAAWGIEMGGQEMVERFSQLLSRVYTLSLEDLKNDEGQTTVEYAVVLVLVVVMAIAVFAVLQGGLTTVMNTITSKITSIIPSQI